ncbi:hypothetical protein [Paraburkholderia sp. EG304]|uniref:hypothetical protein n=1 Tax=Paraburkholderia sp. EG304 TaxID=3237015 RepID=UPI00397C70BA
MTKKQSGSSVTIDVNGAGLGKVMVDGVEVPCVKAVSSIVEANKVPVVTFDLAVSRACKIQYEAAAIRINSLTIPLPIELELWKYLAAKYGREIDVTTLGSTAREWILRDR